MWAKADRPARDAAVIDIGSNSVRLVVYRLEGRAIWTVFNEKVLAGLGRDLARTDTLSPEGVETALAAVRRFRAVLESVQPGAVFVAATAAVRDAIDGPAFVKRVHDETGYRIRVLSGMEEANYAALGVLAGAPLAQGVVGDLGGSSLELTTVGQGRVGEGITLPLGPLALAASGPFDPIKVRAAVERCLEQADAGRFKTATFHAVGGAWRNLALLQMRMSDYPLRIVHQYGLSATEAQDAARFIAQQSKGSLDRIEGMSRKRSETLPYAATVLDCLIDHLGIQEISLSAFGLREGLLFEAMSSADRALDPLIEGCAALGARQGVAEDLGLALEDWLSTAFATLPAEIRATHQTAGVSPRACRSPITVDSTARSGPVLPQYITLDPSMTTQRRGVARRRLRGASSKAAKTPASPASAAPEIWGKCSQSEKAVTPRETSKSRTETIMGRHQHATEGKTGCQARSVPGRQGLRPFQNPGDHQQDHRTQGRMDDGGHHTPTHGKADARQYQAGDERPQDANHDIPKQAEARTRHQFARQPTGHRADQQHHDQTFDSHGTSGG